MFPLSTGVGDPDKRRNPQVLFGLVLVDHFHHGRSQPEVFANTSTEDQRGFVAFVG